MKELLPQEAQADWELASEDYIYALFLKFADAALFGLWYLVVTEVI